MEIEKKYLLKSLPFELSGFDSFLLRQGYISTSPTIRLRSEKRLHFEGSEKFFLTVKGAGSISREEFELTITGQQFSKLWAKVDDYPIDKIRYLIPLNLGSRHPLTAELDRYLGRLEGLLTVEVEFESLDEACGFIPPNWFGTDVTEDHRYGNSRMSKEIPPM